MHLFAFIVGAQQPFIFFCAATIRPYRIPSNDGERNAKNNETNSENIHHQQEQAAAKNPRAFFGRTSTDRGETGILQSSKKRTYNIFFCCAYQVRINIIMLIMCRNPASTACQVLL